MDLPAPVAEYVPDVDVIDPSEFEPEPTRPGVCATTAQLAAEAAALVHVREYLDEMRALELGGEA